MMRELLVSLVSTPENSRFDITLFSIWHILYVVLILGAALFVALLFRTRSRSAQTALLNFLAGLPMMPYVADFFLMPLAYGSIDVDKLPFHFCTLLSILVLFVRYGNKLRFFKEPIIVLSVVTALMYLCYPGTAIGDISPFCYRVIQTFLYHGSVLTFGLASLVLEDTVLDIRRMWRALPLIGCILAWAAFGNAAYSTEAHAYDWCFITGATFPFIPKALMPLTVLGAVFGMVAVIYGIYYLVKAIVRRKAKP